MDHIQQHLDEFQEAVSCYRKAAIEFGMLLLPDDAEEMKKWQQRIFELYHNKPITV